MLCVMGVPLRNKQWLRIGGVVSVVLLLVYLMISMRSGAKLNEEKLGAAILKNRGLQDNFNKLTEELKRTSVLLACFTSVHIWGVGPNNS